MEITDFNYNPGKRPDDFLRSRYSTSSLPQSLLNVLGIHNSPTTTAESRSDQLMWPWISLDNNKRLLIEVPFPIFVNMIIEYFPTSLINLRMFFQIYTGWVAIDSIVMLIPLHPFHPSNQPTSIRNQWDLRHLLLLLLLSFQMHLPSPCDFLPSFRSSNYWAAPQTADALCAWTLERMFGGFASLLLEYLLLLLLFPSSSSSPVYRMRSFIRIWLWPSPPSELQEKRQTMCSKNWIYCEGIGVISWKECH